MKKIKHLDKWAHFTMNLWLVLIPSLLGYAGVGVATAGVVSSGKELSDYRRDGTMNWPDALADVLGILAALGVWQLAELCGW